MVVFVRGKLLLRATRADTRKIKNQYLCVPGPAADAFLLRCWRDVAAAATWVVCENKKGATISNLHSGSWVVQFLLILSACSVLFVLKFPYQIRFAISRSQSVLMRIHDDAKEIIDADGSGTLQIAELVLWHLGWELTRPSQLGAQFCSFESYCRTTVLCNVGVWMGCCDVLYMWFNWSLKRWEKKLGIYSYWHFNWFSPIGPTVAVWPGYFDFGTCCWGCSVWPCSHFCFCCCKICSKCWPATCCKHPLVSTCVAAKKKCAKVQGLLKIRGEINKSGLTSDETCFAVLPLIWHWISEFVCN